MLKIGDRVRDLLLVAGSLGFRGQSGDRPTEIWRSSREKK